MLKIGDFSKLSRISIRMLRHYDEIGLLVPASTDSFTGYRYYGEAQQKYGEAHEISHGLSIFSQHIFAASCRMVHLCFSNRS